MYLFAQSQSGIFISVFWANRKYAFFLFFCLLNRQPLSTRVLQSLLSWCRWLLRCTGHITCIESPHVLRSATGTPSIQHTSIYRQTYPINSPVSSHTLRAATTTPRELHKISQMDTGGAFGQTPYVHFWLSMGSWHLLWYIQILIIWSLISQLTSTKDWI